MIKKQPRHVDKKLLAFIRTLPCSVRECFETPIHASHIKTRGSWGGDHSWNVVPHCWKHHQEWGMSWSKFFEKYPMFKNLLEYMGWEVVNGKLIHDKNLNS